MHLFFLHFEHSLDSCSACMPPALHVSGSGVGGARNKSCCLGTHGLHFWVELGVLKQELGCVCCEGMGLVWEEMCRAQCCPSGVCEGLAQNCPEMGQSQLFGVRGPSLLQELLLAHPALGSKGFCCQKFHV